MGIRLGIGSLKIGTPFKSGGASWNPSIPLSGEKVNFWVSGRVGTTMPSQIDGGQSATILPVYTTFNGTNDYAVLDNAFINTSSGYIEAYCKVVDTELNVIFSSAAKTLNTKRIWVDVNTDRKARIVLNNVTPAIANVIVTDNALTEGWHTIRWGSTGSAYYINVDGVPVAITATTGANNGNWFDTVLNRTTIGIGCVAISSRIYSKFKCAYVKVDDTNKWICNNESYFYDVIGGLPLTITRPTSLTVRAFDNHISHCLDKGYSLYIRNDLVSLYEFQVPHKDDGTALVTPTVPANMRFVKNVAGDINFHNIADSQIEINSDQWDASDTTLCAAAARTGFYNAATPKRWHISYLHRDDLSTLYYNSGHQGKPFVKITNNSVSNRQLLKEIFSFATNKTDNNLNKILTYTNDFRVTAGICISMDDVHRIDTWITADYLFKNMYRWKMTGSLDLKDDATANTYKVRILAMAGRGHGFENHTLTQPNGDDYIATFGEQAYYDDQIAPNAARMTSILGITPKVFMYAYTAGNYPILNNICFNAGYTGVRPSNQTIPPVTYYDGDSQVLMSNAISYWFSDANGHQGLLDAIDYARAHNKILLIHGHNFAVAEGSPNDMSHSFLEDVLKKACDNNMTFYTIDELLPTLFT